MGGRGGVAMQQWQIGGTTLRQRLLAVMTRARASGRRPRVPDTRRVTRRAEIQQAGMAKTQNS